MPNTKPLERFLDVILTDEEIAKRSREMSSLVIDRRRIKAKAKADAENYAAQIKLLDQKIESEATVIEDGKEIRKVECKEVLSADRAFVDLIRLDTGEIVESRPVTDADRQQELFQDDATTVTFSHLDENGNTVEVITTTPEQLSKAAQNAANFGQGTPVRTKLALYEFEEFKAKITNDSKRFKLCHVDGNPYVFTAHNGLEDEKGNAYQFPTELTAYAVLPLKITGDNGLQKFNCGTGKNPEWWQAVGQATTFTIEQTGDPDLIAEIAERRSKEADSEDGDDADEADMRRWLEPADDDPPPPKKRRGKIKLHDDPSYEAGL